MSFWHVFLLLAWNGERELGIRFIMAYERWWQPTLRSGPTVVPVIQKKQQNIIRYLKIIGRMWKKWNCVVRPQYSVWVMYNKQSTMLCLKLFSYVFEQKVCFVPVVLSLNILYALEFRMCLLPFNNNNTTSLIHLYINSMINDPYRHNC